MFTHLGRDYMITEVYSVPDEAWYLELDLVRDHRTLVMAIVPDEDPAREPTFSFDARAGDLDIPYEVMRWFMDRVDAEVRTSRAWMRLRPELVAVIHGLRQEHLGSIDDADFPDVLATVRAVVPAADLAAVIEAAFGRRPDDR
ncbi:hypothetical protein N7925_06285 [Streptomyces sp. CA-278952]|uniref:hypothetical protein n=1 Tax=Streptomyces sp. CA-278952 TaxID=2980556 RepID=UPI002368BA2A|nr:hypothetical protein [Streptomyces sp. CA-278952]WDG27978.1 hypothetical protein N7925_06285 [Streptomyces sp. CA-278952]